MSFAVIEVVEKPRLRALLDHFAVIDDPREPWRVAHPLPEAVKLAGRMGLADSSSMGVNPMTYWLCSS